MKDNKIQLMYILPNLFTALSIFMGILSVLYSVKGVYVDAAYLILLSLVFDGLDGRVARMTGTTSKFGMEFDSLADIVAFGVAPAMLFYFSIGSEFGKVGTLITALYVVFGAIRLARFNVTNLDIEPSVFIGVPIPTAAVFIAVWTVLYVQTPEIANYGWIMLVVVALVSVLMVSNIRFPSFKKIDMKKANILKALVVVVILFSFVYLYPIEAVAFAMTAYIFYGLGRATLNFIFHKRIKL